MYQNQINRYRKIKICRICSCILIKGINCAPSRFLKNTNDWICNSCDKIKRRNTRIDTIRDGKYIYLKGNKRPYPQDNKCEICHKENKRLQYHHWDDSNLMKGIWSCYLCHMMEEKVDKNLHIVYLKLKKILEDKYGK